MSGLQRRFVDYLARCGELPRDGKSTRRSDKLLAVFMAGAEAGLQEAQAAAKAALMPMEHFAHEQVRSHEARRARKPRRAPHPESP